MTNLPKKSLNTKPYYSEQTGTLKGAKRVVEMNKIHSNVVLLLERYGEIQYGQRLDNLDIEKHPLEGPYQLESGTTYFG